MEFIIKYFLIQRITSVILVVLCSIYYNLFFFVVVILLKIGIPPFHLWILDILKIETQWNNFFILITFQKYYLFLLISTKIQQMVIFIRLLFAFVVFFSIVNLIFNNKIIFIIFFSRRVHSVWIIIRLILSFKIFLLYFIIYTSTIKTLTFLINDNNVITTYNINNIILWWIFWVFMGFPPFSIFIMKWRILVFIMKWRIPLFLLLIVISFVMLYIYIKFIIINLSIKYLIILKKILVKNKYFFILTEIILLSFVLIY